MSFNQDELRNEVNHVCEQFPNVVRQIEEGQNETRRLSSLIDDAKAEISDLIEQRKMAPKRERWSYRESIRDAKDRKFQLIQEVKEARGMLGSLRSEKSGLVNRAKALRSKLQSEQKRLAQSSQKLDAGIPDWSYDGMSGIARAVNAGRHFCREQMELLGRNIFLVDSNQEDIVEVEPYIYVSEKTTGWGNFEAKDGSGLTLKNIEPPRSDQYLTKDNTVCVPCSSYSVYDTINLENATTESLGTKYTTALLQAIGHSVVMELGGSRMPDVISLDASNDLWITEVKGTESGTELYAAGLKRPSGLFENSREWLQLKAPHVLEELEKAAAREESPSTKEGLRLLLMKFSEAVGKGFDPGSYKNQVVQVGLSKEGEYLRPPGLMRSEALDEYCKEVMPNNIVQIDVVSGSSASELAES